jgi:photosystem II stability/assembly factor-like uncharacterized protein
MSMKVHYISLLLLGFLTGCVSPRHPTAITPLPKTSAASGSASPLGSAKSASGTDYRHGVKAEGSHEYMYVSADGQKAWYSALELERIARDYAQSEKLDFDFADTEKKIWVHTDGGRVLATVWFSSAIGKPSLCIEIGRSGKVIGHKIAVLYY